MGEIFDYVDCVKYLNDWIRLQPRGGRGFKSKFAHTLQVSSTMISFVLKGKKLLTLEQACDLAEFMGLSEAETDYFFLLVEYDRAGHHRLKQKLLRKINAAQKESKRLASRVKKDIDLSEELKATYYSSWVYTGLRNLVAAGEFKDVRSMARRLNLSQVAVTEALQFLLENRLCIEKGGLIEVGPAYTHVDADSPYVNRHRQNWRLRGLTMMDHKCDTDLFYSCPMSISQRDSEKIRDMVLGYIEEILAVMKPVPFHVV